MIFKDAVAADLDNFYTTDDPGVESGSYAGGGAIPICVVGATPVGDADQARADNTLTVRVRYSDVSRPDIGAAVTLCGRTWHVARVNWGGSTYGEWELELNGNARRIV